MVHVPTEGEIRDILEPWRPQWARFAAAKVWHSFPEQVTVWIRTHYDSDPDIRRRHDELFATWVACIRDEEQFETNANDTLEDALKWLIWDNESLFNVGRDWERALDTMPELIGPRTDSKTTRLSISDLEGQSWFHDDRKLLRDDLLKISDTQGRIKHIEGLANYVQADCVHNAIVVVDQEAFDKEKLKIVFADSRGNTVRYAFTKHDSDWFYLRRELDGGGKLELSQEWYDEFNERESGIGEAYRVTGAIGKNLYQVDDLLDGS